MNKDEMHAKLLDQYLAHQEEMELEDDELMYHEMELEDDAWLKSHESTEGYDLLDDDWGDPGRD